MIIPSRWFSGGKGLDEFRAEMLNDRKLTKLIDYFDSNECFPGVDISGGVCYFLRERDKNDNCEVTSVFSGEKSILKRPLLENNNDSFIRFNEAISIVRKVSDKKEKLFKDLISSRNPFGLTTNVKPKKDSGSDTILYAYPNNGYIEKNSITKNRQWVNKYKVLISYAYGERGSFPYLVIGKPFFANKNTVCTETYLIIGIFSTKRICENVISYMKTKFFRFLVLLRKNTQHATSKVYSLIPIQDFSEPWTDEKLYKKYGLTQEEINFIESMIRPME